MNSQPRTWQIVLAGLFIAGVILVAIGVVKWIETEGPLEPLPATAEGPMLVGTQTHTTWGSHSDKDMVRELDLLHQSGSNLIRADMNWSSLETDAKGRFTNWYINKWDRLLELAEARNIKVIATVFGTPCWASSAPEKLRQNCNGEWWDRGVTAYPPTDNRDFADAVAWMADRWGDRLVGMEIWNGPNLPEQRFLVANNLPKTYVGMLKAAYPRAKDASPNLNVIGGVIEWADIEFLEDMYHYGAKDYFDSLSVHPYNEWRSPNIAWKPEWIKFSFKRGVPAMRKVMVDNGDGHKKMWLTEYGWSTCTDGDRWCVSKAEQAEFIADSLKIAREWDYVAGVTIYQLRDAEPGVCRECEFGMLERDWEEKPAWQAYVRAVGGVYPATARVGGEEKARFAAGGRRIAGLWVACDGVRRSRCRGRIVVRINGVRVGKRDVALAAGSRKKVSVKLNGKGRRIARQRQTQRSRLNLDVTWRPRVG